MATAKEPGGLYYVDGKAVDAEGREIKGAPKQSKDTPPEKQPGAVGGPAADPFQRLADTISSALGGKSGTAAENSASGADEVTLADLSDHISGMSADEVKALKRKDDRRGAVPIYEARLEELKG